MLGDSVRFFVHRASSCSSPFCPSRSSTTALRSRHQLNRLLPSQILCSPSTFHRPWKNWFYDSSFISVHFTALTFNKFFEQTADLKWSSVPKLFVLLIGISPPSMYFLQGSSNWFGSGARLRESSFLAWLLGFCRMTQDTSVGGEKAVISSKLLQSKMDSVQKNKKIAFKIFEGFQKLFILTHLAALKMESHDSQI